MVTGTVKWFNETLGFGYVVRDDNSQDVYIHISVLQKCGLRCLKENQKVNFEVTSGLGKEQIKLLQLIS